MWYMDCYCYAALLGKDFPVNSYYSESLVRLMEVGESILLSQDESGIDAITFAKETKGMAAIHIDEGK